jgi:predicted aspartyl protease
MKSYGRRGAFGAVVIGIILCAAPALAAPSAQISFPGFVGVQMRRGPQNHLIVQAQVNGKPATFLVDTGADISFFRADRAQQFALRPQGGEVQRRGRSFRVAAIGNFSIGGASFGPTEVALVSASQFRGTAPGRGIPDGVIGLDLLKRRDAIINCRTRQLFLKTDPASRLDLQGITRPMGFTRISLDVTRRGAFTVPVRVRGRAGRLLVDTGAFVTGLDDDALRALGVSTRPSGLTTRGFDGEIRPFELAQIDDLKIAGVPIAPQTFAVMDLYGKKKPLRTFTGLNRIEYYAQRSPAEQILGVLGNELLDQRNAIIDIGGMSLFLK